MPTRVVSLLTLSLLASLGLGASCLLVGCSGPCTVVRSRPEAPARGAEPARTLQDRRYASAWADGFPTPNAALEAAQTAAGLVLAREISVALEGSDESLLLERVGPEGILASYQYESRSSASVGRLEFRGLRTEDSYHEGVCADGRKTFSAWARVSVPLDELAQVTRLAKGRSVLTVGANCQGPCPELQAALAILRPKLQSQLGLNLAASDFPDDQAPLALAQAQDAALVLHLDLALIRTQTVKTGSGEEFYAWGQANLEAFEGRDGKLVWALSSGPPSKGGAYQPREAARLALEEALKALVLKLPSAGNPGTMQGL